MSHNRLTIAIVVFAFVAAACGTGGAGRSSAPSSTSPAGQPAPTRPFELFEGSETTLADFTGRPVVLNFWASWCPSCVAEMSAAFRPVEERIGDQVTFIGMNIQDVRSLADDLLAETGVEWINGVDPDGELYVELGGLGMPFTVFIDASGNVVDEHNGPLNETQLADHISELFGVTA
jgi:cytochrome c biogenesis protein CcmG/thiol:disulfide interchange protein DsbE